jgi:pimeloyl-[acyl-carrier protein] methyl ester esterase
MAILPSPMRCPRHCNVTAKWSSWRNPSPVHSAYCSPIAIPGVFVPVSFVRAPLPFSVMGAALLQRLPAIAPPMFALEHVLAGSGLPAPLRAEFEAIMDSIPLDVLRQRAQAALRVDVTRELVALDMPVLYLQARHDRLIGPYTSCGWHATRVMR